MIGIFNQMDRTEDDMTYEDIVCVSDNDNKRSSGNYNF